MRATVVVEDQAAFDRWAARQKNARDPRADVTAEAGEHRSARGPANMPPMTTGVAAPHHPDEPRRVRAADAARLDPRRLDDRAGAAFGFGLVVGLRALQGFPIFEGSPIVTVILIAAPLAFLVGIGGFDYWALVHHRLADEARRPLRPRRAQLEGLLPGQHRPQGDRGPVHGHRAVLPAGRRRARGGDPRRARAAGPADRRPEHLQRPVLGPRRR